MKQLTVIARDDNVAVALCPITKGEKLETTVPLRALDDIPAGHKVALTDIAEGQKVIKYGFPIGVATQAIPAGSHVHTHNVRTLLSGTIEYRYDPQPAAPRAKVESRTFMGYRRSDGRVGVRNEIWILPTVGCVNGQARTLERRAQALVKDGLDAVYAFPHPYGCSQMGEDQENTRRILADLAMHPNCGGVLLLGLGCENSGIDSILAYMEGFDRTRVRTLVCQRSEDELKEGLALLSELAALASKDKREPCPASELTIGLKCGGSDGFSGLTANPVIGGLSDLLIAQGGSTILTEVPEMFGAETLLMARCENKALFDKTVHLINDFKDYFSRYGQTIYENPSPGNKAGGITTLEDKALGCTQKSGFAPVQDVLQYGERVRVKGLSLLSSPGNDLVASTALAAAGAQIVLFSTGRGTPFGSPVPTVKISSNTALWERKRNWIDFDAGVLLKDDDKDALAQKLMDYCLSVASGEKVQSEVNGYHDMAIFKTGVTL